MPRYLFPCLSRRLSSLSMLAGCAAVDRVCFVAGFFAESLSRYACFSCLTAWRHRRGLHDRRLLMFTCAVCLLDICRVDRLVFSSSSWPSLCRLSWLPSSLFNPFRCAFVMLCFIDPALSVIDAASCRSGSSRWHSYGSSDAPVAPAVLHVLFLASLLFVHFACSSWPSCALRGLSLRRILTGNYAGKNAHFF